jgi:urease alpha subunit
MKARKAKARKAKGRRGPSAAEALDRAEAALCRTNEVAESILILLQRVEDERDALVSERVRMKREVGRYGIEPIVHRVVSEIFASLGLTTAERLVKRGQR